MTAIFINYRRDDSAGYAGRLYDHIKQRLGFQNVFLDLGTIAPGDDVQDRIEKELTNCRVFIAVIGNRWLTIEDSSGNRRLDNRNDFVRMEIAEALRHKIKLIPVLVQEAKMPKAENLPDDIKGLSRFNAVTLTDKRFERDVAELIEAIRDDVRTAQVATSKSSIPMPKVAHTFTDKQRADFLSQAFQAIKAYFQAAVNQAGMENSSLEIDLQEITNRKFICTAYLDGKQRNSCKIWLTTGSMMGNGIGYMEGRFEANNDNQYNEMVTVETDQAEIYLHLSLSAFSLIGTTLSSNDRFDAKAVAEILWSRFIARI